MNKKHHIIVFITSIAITALVQVAVIGLIRNLGSLISLLGPLFGMGPADVKQFSSIFAQLSTARLVPSVTPIILFFFCFLWLLRSNHKPKSNAARAILTCLLGIVLFLVAVITVLLLTNVNGIRFVNVLLSLLHVLSAGGF